MRMARPGKKRLQVVVTLDQEQRLREAAAQDGYEDDLSGWIREAALTKAGEADLSDDTLEPAFIEESRTIEKEHELRLRGMKTVIVIRFFTRAGATGVWWEQSHFIKTPLQAGPYRTSLPRGDSLQQALRKAIHGLTSFYDMAVRENQTPHDGWLITNKKFKQFDTV